LLAEGDRLVPRLRPIVNPGQDVTVQVNHSWLVGPSSPSSPSERARVSSASPE
jgi:hypothetical protein